MMTTVKTKVQDAVLNTIEDLIIPRVELAMKSVNASPGRDADSVVTDPDQGGFLRNIETFRMTASNRMNWKTNFKKIG